MDILSGLLGFHPQPHLPTVSGSTYYRLAPDTRALEIETVVTNVSEVPQAITGGDGLIPSDHFGAPYMPGAGFARKRMQGETDFIGVVGERNEGAFGLMPPHGESFTLPLPADLVIQRDMAVFIGRLIRCELQPDESCSWRRYAVVSESPARARTAVLARQGVRASTITGRVTGVPGDPPEPVAGARVFLTRADDPQHVLDLDVSDEQGRFHLHPGDAAEVTLWARPTDRGETAFHPLAQPPLPQAEGYLPADPVTVTVAQVTGDIELTMVKPATAVLELRDAHGEPLPGKFSFVATDPSPVARNLPFDEWHPYDTLPSPIRKVVWQAHAQEIAIGVAPGVYDVIASFGIEYELDRLDDVVLEAGQTRVLSFELQRAMDLTGWAQCDTHLHTSYSNHGRTSHADRVITLVAEGVNCAAITDHDRVFDFQPLVRALNLQDRVHTFPSVEVSTFLRGHINPYPIYPDSERIDPDSRFPVRGDGHVLPWWDPGWTVHRLFERMRELGARIIQINHGVGSGQYFTMTGYDPTTGMGNRDFSNKFDVFELVNGKRLGVVPELRAIAFSLWDRGHRKTVVGVSDSHTRIPEPGYARTLVRVGADWHANMHEDPPIDALLRMDAVVSNGVFVDMSVTVDGARFGYGQTVIGSDLPVDIRVYAPNWVDLREARLIWNGEIDPPLASFDLTGSASTTPAAPRWTGSVTVPAAEDGWFVLEVFGDGDLWPVSPGAQPYAMTNPIFVDADGQGWEPPRTPAPAGMFHFESVPAARFPSRGCDH